MNWQIFFLITYAFILGVLLLLLSFYLYSRWIRRQASASVKASSLPGTAPVMNSETRKIDFQQIERLVRLHQDVKDDLSNYGDVLVAMRNEQLTARTHQQKQIDICLGFIESEQKKLQMAEEAKQQTSQAVSHETDTQRPDPASDDNKSIDQPQLETCCLTSRQRPVKTAEKHKFQRRQIKGETTRDQVMKLIRFGMEPDQISQKTGLSRVEIDLMVSLQPQEA